MWQILKWTPQYTWRLGKYHVTKGFPLIPMSFERRKRFLLTMFYLECACFILLLNFSISMPYTCLMCDQTKYSCLLLVNIDITSRQILYCELYNVCHWFTHLSLVLMSCLLRCLPLPQVAHPISHLGSNWINIKVYERNFLFSGKTIP